MTAAKSLCRAGLALVLIAGPAWAIDIGDPAPAVGVSTWVKNGPVDVAAGKGKNFFVIEFWATWCRPCVENIPHLTEIQNKYRDKGLVVIGVTDEPAETVKPFVEKMGDKMGYAVAIDKRETTSGNYMGAVGAEGIPYAFVIDKTGALAWHGHPQMGMDTVLEQMAAGKFDIQQAKREAAAAQTMNEYFQVVEHWNRTTNADERPRIAAHAHQVGEKLIEQAGRSPDILNEFASTIVLMPETEYRDLNLVAEASQAAYQASAKTPTDKSRKLMLDYFRTLRAEESKQPTATQPARGTATQPVGGPDEIAAQILKQAGPEELKSFAWAIMMAPDLKHRDLQLALEAADAARTATKDQDATALETYARALFENGQRQKAVEYSRKAVEVNKDEELTPVLKQSLEDYEKAVQESQANR